jgi:hypothetical protein
MFSLGRDAHPFGWDGNVPEEVMRVPEKVMRVPEEVMRVGWAGIGEREGKRMRGVRGVVVRGGSFSCGCEWI